MKKIFLLSMICVLLASCEIRPVDPETEKNRKSALVVETNNAFGLELFRKVLENEEKQNVMISPASVSLALGMAYNGAETTTREAFEQVLNYEDLSREEVNEVCRDLIDVLVSETDGNLLEIANSIWHEQTFPVKQSFLDLNNTYFDAEVRSLDFSDPAAVDIINSWVSEKTHEKIDKIIDELDPLARMLLINALYFNCLWEISFDQELTEMQMFYKDNLSEYGEVEMMVTEGAFRCFYGNVFRGVELPYRDEKYSMILLMPEYGSTLDDIIVRLNGDAWKEWMDGAIMNMGVQVCIPKFKFEYKRSMGADLKAMGLQEAFTALADFSGISNIPLMISRVIHKTFIDVNEEGTEAAAVTAIEFVVTGEGPSGPDLITFDRPFLFAITENSSKSIVFIGKVSEPEYSNH